MGENLSPIAWANPKLPTRATIQNRNVTPLLWSASRNQKENREGHGCCG